MPLSKEEFEDGYGSHVSIIAECWRAANDAVNSLREQCPKQFAKMREGTVSKIMSDMIGQAVEERFVGVPGVVAKYHRQCVTVYTGDVAIRFKKLSAKGHLPSYTPTRAARLHFEQQQPGLELGLKEITSLISGYVNGIFGGIGELLITCPLGRNNLWEFSVPMAGEDFGGGTDVIITPPSQPGGPTAPRIKVKPELIEKPEENAS